MRGRRQAARTPIDVNANVCPKSVHEGVVNRRAPTFGSQSLLHVGTSLVSLFPSLMIDIANLISDFDTAPPGRPHRYSSPPRAPPRHMFARLRLRALQPATIGSCRRNSIRLPPGRIETKTPLPHINCSPLYAVSTWELQEDVPPMWTVPTSGANIQTFKCLLANTNIALIPFLTSTNL